MRERMKKLAAGLLAAVMTVTALACALAPADAYAAADKAMKIPVKFNGKNWDNDANLAGHSCTHANFQGGDITVKKGDKFSISYTLYVPKKVLAKEGASIEVSVHPYFADNSETYSGDIQPMAWIKLEKSGSKVTAAYWDSVKDTHPKAPGTTVKAWGDYYQVTVKKYPMKGLCAPDSWDLAALPKGKAYSGSAWVNIDVYGINTKVTSFVLLDNVTFYRNGKAVFSQNFSGDDCMENAGYEMNGAKKKAAKAVTYTKKLGAVK